MERASSTVTSKPKILPVVLLSSIPLKLFGSGKEKRYGKVNIRLNRTQPYEADNQRSLSERTSCSNCNKQTNNQSSSISSTIQAVSSMIQSPMLILPIVSAATTKSAISQAKIHSNVYCNHQHQQQQQLHQPVYFAAKKVDELNIGGNNGTVCRVREISCSFKHTNYNFFFLLATHHGTASSCHWCVLSLPRSSSIFHVMSFSVAIYIYKAKRAFFWEETREIIIAPRKLRLSSIVPALMLLVQCEGRSEKKIVWGLNLCCFMKIA